MKMKITFFIIFYVILGTTGITLPWLVEQAIVLDEVAIGLVTIVMSTVSYNATEQILRIIEEKKNLKDIAFVNIVALVFALIFTIVVCHLDGVIAIIVSIIAYVLSCVFWWFQNRDNKNIMNTSTSTLGGDTSQFK